MFLIFVCFLYSLEFKMKLFFTFDILNFILPNSYYYPTKVVNPPKAVRLLPPFSQAFHLQPFTPQCHEYLVGLFLDAVDVDPTEPGPPGSKVCCESFGTHTEAEFFHVLPHPSVWPSSNRPEGGGGGGRESAP